VTVAEPVVIDASAFMRFHLGSDEAAEVLHDVWRSGGRLLAPELILAEVASALLRYTRSAGLAVGDAEETLGDLSRTVGVWPLDVLFPAAFALAAERGLSAYAAYVELAEALDARLVTADRRLAAATPNAVLVA
jgi:predicted nucleic acid-binding protein